MGSTMPVRHIVLTNRSSQDISFAQLSEVAVALQTQVDRDFAPIWGIRAQIMPLNSGDQIPRRAWPIFIMDQSEAGLGVHLDQHRKPFAEVQAGRDWSITASHELLEMLVDPLGHRLVRAPDIDPHVHDGHLVSYLQEVCDPCEVFAYAIGQVGVSDFVTPDYYNPDAPEGAELDFLKRLSTPYEVPKGCYISWEDPLDGRWHQKKPDGTFVTAKERSDAKRNPRDDRDHAFGDDEDDVRHDLRQILTAYAPDRIMPPAVLRVGG
jgi:hypothetical protein